MSLYRLINCGEVVRVYRNIKNNSLSVLVYVRGKGWRLSHHRNHIFLYDVKFIVSESGRQRVLREKRKNVHAFVEGKFVTESSTVNTRLVRQKMVENKDGRRVRYNPYAYSTFMTIGKTPQQDAPVYSANYCSVSTSMIRIFS